jgi:hypothetical protein
MTFDEKFTEFLAANPALKTTRDTAEVTFTIRQLKQVCFIFWKAGRAIREVPSIFDMIFGKWSS